MHSSRLSFRLYKNSSLDFLLKYTLIDIEGNFIYVHT